MKTNEPAIAGRCWKWKRNIGIHDEHTNIASALDNEISGLHDEDGAYQLVRILLTNITWRFRQRELLFVSWIVQIGVEDHTRPVKAESKYAVHITGLSYTT